MKQEKYFTKSVYYPVCANMYDLYHLDNLDNIKKKQKQMTLHCNSKECRATFIILKKKRQEWLFKKSNFHKGKIIW